MKILNYINGEWVEPNIKEYFDVINPATIELVTRTPMCSQIEINAAASAATNALPIWRRIPAETRVQYLFKLKFLLEESVDEISRTIVIECGKTYEEAKAETRRAIENVEVACGIPMLMKGEFSEDIAPGIDEIMIRQPVGVCVAICPFNFPIMIPFWFLPYAIACGNTFIVKPSEKVPLTMQLIFKLIDKLDLPRGVINLVNGGKEAVDAILQHPAIRGITFVGSSTVARYIYSQAAAQGKRVLAQGGAKNPVLIMPDADMESATRIVADSAFGCAGQRCLAVSWAILIGSVRNEFTERICEAALKRKVGYGLDSNVEMGPLINQASKIRVEQVITQGVANGAHLLIDGRHPKIKDYESGSFVKPTVMVTNDTYGDLTRSEIFGPVLTMSFVDDFEDALQLINKGKYGNQASVFTTNGAIGRRFRYEADFGNIGINIGVAAPMAFFPFSGWRESFFGDLYGQGKDAVQFFTQEKVVVERWPKEWLRKF